MQRRRLGGSGIVVSDICMGTMTFGTQCDESTSHAICDRAWDTGIDFFDAAELYPVPPSAELAGRTEQILGRWLKTKPREAVVIATKVTGPGHGWFTPPIRHGKTALDRHQIHQACDASLRRLKTDYIDLYQTHWPELAAKIMAAAPNATLIVAGSHPQNALREHDNESAIEVDDFLRVWCAVTPGAIFVDVRQNFPEFQEGFEGNTESIDDLWVDGIHIGGKGQFVVSQLVWDAIEPAFQYAKIVQPSSSNSSNVLPMVPTEIRLFDQRAISNRTTKLALTVHPRAPSSLMIRSSDAPYFPGNQSWYYESGLWVRASTDVYPSALSLFSDGQTALSFGHHPSLHALQGIAVGVANSHTTNAGRAADGYRFRVPTPTYGKRSGLIVEGRADSPQDSRLLGIDVDSTDAAQGAPLWSWMEDGAVIYEGQSADANQMTLRFEEPASDVTLTTPAKTGVIGVVPAYANELAAKASGLGAGDNYWDTTLKRLRTILR